MAKKLEIDVEVNTAKAVQGVDNLTKSTDKLGESAEGVSKTTESLGGSLDSLGGGFGGAISGAKALGKQFLALIANPIGLVIAAIAVAVATLYKAFARTETGGNKLSKGMNVLSGVMSSFFKAIEPIAVFIVDVAVGAFESLGKAAEEAAKLVSSALEFLGFEEAAKAVKKFVESTGELIDKTTELSDLEAKLLKTRREQSLIEKQALIDAEKLRQQRDDESNSLAERIEFNRQLSDVLQKQSEDELAIANDALRVAQLKLQIDGETTEALDGLAEAQLELLDIEERINGQRSEQLANENSLRNEGIAKEKERVAIAAEEAKAKLAEEEKAKEEAIAKQLEADAVEKERKDKIAKEEETRLKEEVAALKTVESTKQKIREAGIDNVKSGIDLIAGLDEDNKALQAATIVATNVAGIAKTVITTQAANATAFAEGVALAIPSGGTSVAAATALIASNNISVSPHL